MDLNVPELPSANEFLCTRLVAAPRDLVFRAWTEPDLLKGWWDDPAKFTLETCEADLRPGGAYRRIMRGANGKVFIQQGVYETLDAPALLAYSESCDEEGAEPFTWRVVVTFDEYFGKTLVSIRAIFDDVPDAGWRAAWMQGQREVFARLAASYAGTSDTAAREFELIREFNAPPELVFDAWTQPEHMAQWWGPNGFTSPDCRMDAQPGGAFRIVMRAPDGQDFPFKGHFLEVHRPYRLVYTNDCTEHGDEFADAIDPARDKSRPLPPVLSITEVSFESHNNRTRMSVRMTFEQVKYLEGSQRVGMSQGWQESFDKLAGILPAAD